MKTNPMKSFLRVEALAVVLMVLTCLTKADKVPLGARSAQMVGGTLRRSKAPKTSSKSGMTTAATTVDTTPAASAQGPKTMTTIKSTSTTSKTAESISSSKWSQTVQVLGSDGKCIGAVLKLVDCDTKAAEIIFTSSASTCSTTFDFSNKQQFCLTLVVGSFIYNAGPIYTVNSATTSTSATIILTVTSSHVFLQYGTQSKSVMTSNSPVLTVTSTGSTSATTTTTTTTSTSSSTWSQTVQIVGSSGQCIDAVLKLVDCDTKAAETIFSSSSSTCSTTFDFSNKQQFCLSLVVGSFVYNAGPISAVSTTTTSTGSMITIKVNSAQAFLQYGTSSQIIMTSGASGGLFSGSGGSAPISVVSPPISAPISVVPPPISAPIAVVSPPISATIPIAVAPPISGPIAIPPPMSVPFAVAPPVTSAPAPGDKKVDLISNDWGN